jgi:hypothetical protein
VVLDRKERVMGRRLGHRGLVASALAAACMAAAPVRAEGEAVEQLRRDLEGMKRQMEQLQEQMRRQEEIIRALEAQEPLAAPAPAEPPPAAALDRALEEARRKAPPAIVSRPLGGTTLRLIDVSFDVLFAAGASTEEGEALRDLQGGAHDPRRRGFTLQQGELSLTGAVDPYFTAESHVIFTPEAVELEEAFFTTTALPWGLQLEGGHFFTEFGRINPLHPHAWHWIDQPVVNTRLFGPDGLRNPGLRLGWLLPLPWYSQLHLGAQDAGGETAVSFLGEATGGGHGHDEEEGEEEEATGVGGRPATGRGVRRLEDLLYLTRWEHGGSLGETLGANVGVSALFGPNASGRRARTRIYGGDAVLKWRPVGHFRGWPFLVLESEVMKREFEAAAAADPALPADTLHDWGLYAQALYGFRYGWAAGLRYELAGGSGPSVGGRQADALRDDRHRLSPLLLWHPTEYSRLRLQYNYDRARHLAARDAHAAWLGVEVFYGAHAAHAY